MQSKHWEKNIYKEGGGMGCGPLTTEYLRKDFTFLYFSSFCRTAPCPLEVTIESQFALVLG